MRPVTVTKQLSVAADADGIAQLQQLAGAGNFTLNGALVASGVAQLGSQRKVAVHSAGNIAAVVFTIYGTDDQGREITDTVTGVNNSTVSTTLDFATVTRVAAGAAVGSDTEVGTTGVGASLPIPLDIYLPFGSTVSVDVTGTINYTIQATNDNPFGNPSTPLNWVAYPGNQSLSGQTTDLTSVATAAVRAIRILVNSGAGSAAVTLTQQGLIV